VGRDRARYPAIRLSIPPVVTVRATFTAHGDRLKDLMLFSFRRHSRHFIRVIIRLFSTRSRLQAVALPPGRGFPTLRVLGPR